MRVFGPWRQERAVPRELPLFSSPSDLHGTFTQMPCLATTRAFMDMCDRSVDHGHTCGACEPKDSLHCAAAQPLQRNAAEGPQLAVSSSGARPRHAWHLGLCTSKPPNHLPPNAANGAAALKGPETDLKRASIGIQEWPLPNPRPLPKSAAEGGQKPGKGRGEDSRGGCLSPPQSARLPTRSMSGPMIDFSPLAARTTPRAGSHTVPRTNADVQTYM